MTQLQSHSVRITEPAGQAALSKAQKAFNNLIKKIDKQRELLASWQSSLVEHQQKYAGKFRPLFKDFNEHRARLVSLFDASYDNKLLSKTDKTKLAHIICAITEELIGTIDDDNLKAMYNRYSGSDFDAEEEEVSKETVNTIKAMMEEMLGMELGDDLDVSSPQKIMEQVEQKMREKQAQEDAHPYSEQRNSKPRKKSAKQIAKEEKLEAEEKSISQSIREVFRKLASSLHPDKEQDPIERERKTALMQKVNVAYENRNLLQLLELQLQVEQIDQTTINAISEERLKHYNKVLTDQSRELQQEIQDIEFSFRERFNYPPFEPVTPQKILRFLQDDITGIKSSIAELKEDLRAFGDIKHLKAWLKNYRIQKRRSYDEDIFSAMNMDFPF